MEQEARKFFEPKLKALGLGVSQIESQSLPELEDSLERIADAARHPEQFGVLRLNLTAGAGVVIARASSESIVEVGILPSLLERKRLVLDRIRTLKPQDQLKSLREQISKSVDDSGVRETLLRILDNQQDEQRKFSHRIEVESRELGAAIQGERRVIQDSIVMVKMEALDAAFRARSENFEKALDKLEGKSVSKYDVVAVVFLILASLGGLVGAIAALLKWINP
ncbi:hypothetical protein AB0C47_16235 [Micromonospora taraxaci]|uniref:hypothetical protein n=1 Tax=Micromonospora taraxaci TaxID=1316803 RepID=UPI0033C11931